MRRSATRFSTAAALAVAVVIALISPASVAGNGGNRDHIVEIVNFRFSPEELTVAPGDTVTWINRDIVPHTATSRDGDWDSETVQAEGQWRMTIREGQNEDYFCRFHPSMVGRLRIVASDAIGEPRNNRIE